ncbi:hypothetical protein [Streptomyces iconiensis]|uniref:Uncharacterized protein n=1 Tax=Streptomyces iconiensis TaxID=1384038 RepID=A0ABT6ZXJ0_9ACTN|nr:hypothetical protein [Streptomyces iconiensis]MDJ1133788.1 hypothetical protein [Streptomyces iconiensis]
MTGDPGSGTRAAGPRWRDPGRGSCLGSFLSFLTGTVVALASPLPDAMAGFDQAAGSFGPVLLVLFLFSVVNHNALNLYGASLSLITIWQTFRVHWVPRLVARSAASGSWSSAPWPSRWACRPIS